MLSIIDKPSSGGWKIYCYAPGSLVINLFFCIILPQFAMKKSKKKKKNAEKTQKCWFPNLRILVKIIVAYFYPFWIKMKWKTAKTAKTKIFKSKCSGNHPFSCQNLQQLKSRDKIEEALHMRHNRVTKNC